MCAAGHPGEGGESWGDAGEGAAAEAVKYGDE